MSEIVSDGHSTGYHITCSVEIQITLLKYSYVMILTAHIITVLASIHNLVHSNV